MAILITESSNRSYKSQFEDIVQEKLGDVDASVPQGMCNHSWTTPSYVWSFDLSSVTAARICRFDVSHIEEETVSAVITVTAPSEESGGSAGCISNEFINTGFTAQTLIVGIPALKDMSVLYLPSMLEEIGEEAYENTAGEAVIVPAGCEMIGRYAFRNSQNLRYIRIPEKTVIAPDAFEECVCVVIDQYADQ